MARQSISFTAPNEAWLKEQIESEEYTSKSEVVNDLIRRARENEYIRNKLISAEEGGFSNLTRDEILAKARVALDGDAKL
jgi:antitoxin ParD1/3/4